MVKRRKHNNRKKRTKARKIIAFPAYEMCTEQLSPIGGLLALIRLTESFYPGKVLKQPLKPDLILSSPIVAAPRFLIPTSSVSPSNVKHLNTTAASTNPAAGAGRVVLCPCVF